MESIGKRALLILVSSLFGSALWLAGFVAVIVGNSHLHLEDRSVIGGAFSDAGGFMLAGALGIAGAVYMLRRLWRMVLSK
jgi:hypothetical protein